MHIETAFTTTRRFLGAAAVACTLLAGHAAARDKPIVASVHVSTQGLDLSKPDGASEFYRRLKRAARVVCTHGNQVGLEPLPDPAGCAERALGEAIRFVREPLLTRIYLRSHTLQEAAAYGIDVPAQAEALASTSPPRTDSE